MKGNLRPETRWELARPASRAELLALMREWQVSPPVAQVLAGRGVTPALLAPALTLTANPALREAVERAGENPVPDDTSGGASGQSDPKAERKTP